MQKAKKSNLSDKDYQAQGSLGSEATTCSLVPWEFIQRSVATLTLLKMIFELGAMLPQPKFDLNTNHKLQEPTPVVTLPDPCKKK